MPTNDYLILELGGKHWFLETHVHGLLFSMYGSWVDELISGNSDDGTYDSVTGGKGKSLCTRQHTNSLAQPNSVDLWGNKTIMLIMFIFNIYYDSR